MTDNTPAERLAAFADACSRDMILAIVVGDHRAHLDDLNAVLEELALKVERGESLEEGEHRA